MQINSKRANEIKTYIKSHRNAKQGKWPVEIMGSIKKEPYYKLPIRLLRYSVENGRFAAEKLALEVELNRTLDPEDSSDVNEIKKMLLEADLESTQKLEDDLLEKGQLEPGVVTADGYIKNGNRRMAILEKLHKEHSSGKYQYLNVVILPEDVSESDLWRIEAGLQLSQETKLDYGPINELLKIKEGADAGLTEKEMASAMFGWTEEKVKEALDRLKLIEYYLEYSLKPKKYKDAENTHEYFIDLQKLIKKWVNEGVDSTELDGRIKVAFSYTDNVNIPERRTSHKDIRRMAEIFDSPKASKTFLESISERAHKRSEKNPLASTAYLAHEGFKDAIDIVDSEKQRNRPDRLLKRAISSLEEISNIIDSGGNIGHENNIKLIKNVKKIVDDILEKTGINETKSTPKS